MSALGKQTKTRLSLVKTYAGVIIKYGNSVLLGKRSLNGCVYEGHWSIPAGEVEEGESAFGAAERELFEETGIKIEYPLEYLWQFSESDGEKFYVYLYKTNKLLTASPDAKDKHEHSEWGYFRLERNCMPLPMSKEIEEAIFKLT